MIDMSDQMNCTLTSNKITHSFEPEYCYGQLGECTTFNKLSKKKSLVYFRDFTAELDQ